MFEFISDWLIILLIIVLNSFFVIAEIAIIASRKSKLEKMVQEQNLGASYALELANKPETFLSSVQIGITLMNILIGLYGGTEISNHFKEYIENIPALAKYTEFLSHTIVVVIVTYLTVLGEIVPKRIAMLYPEKISGAVGRGMFLFTKISHPFVWILTISTKFVLKVMNIKSSKTDISIEEIKHIINQAETSGTLEKVERDILRRFMNLGDTQVGAIMTPRKQMVCIDMNDSVENNIKNLKMHHFNHLPLIKGDLDNFIGLVSARDLFDINSPITNEVIEKAAKKEKVPYIPEMANVIKLMELLKKNKARMAIVLDEYGDIEGIVTLNDILKTFTGDLGTLIEGRKSDIIKKHRDGSLTVDGNMLIEEIMDIMNVSSLPGDNIEDYRTLASFILKQLNRVPKKGESFKAMGWVFKVTKMDKFRIERVLLKKNKKPLIKK